MTDATGGRRLDGYTLSSSCEPNGSGGLKKWVFSETIAACDLKLIELMKMCEN